MHDLLLPGLGRRGHERTRSQMETLMDGGGHRWIRSIRSRADEVTSKQGHEWTSSWTCGNELTSNQMTSGQGHGWTGIQMEMFMEEVRSEDAQKMKGVMTPEDGCRPWSPLNKVMSWHRWTWTHVNKLTDRSEWGLEFNTSRGHQCDARRRLVAPPRESKERTVTALFESVTGLLLINWVTNGFSDDGKTWRSSVRFLYIGIKPYYWGPLK